MSKIPLPLPIELGPNGNGIQIVRTVADTLDECNIACSYCDNFNSQLKGNFLPAAKIADILRAANSQSQLDVVLSGGEITLHPEFEAILAATHATDRTGITLITNTLALDEQKIRALRNSNVSRICISLDGATAEAHNFARGRNFDQVLRGLNKLQETGKSITVISVLHKGNVDDILSLSEFLVKNRLAQQHHFAALYFSGRARYNWQKLIIPWEKIQELQDKIDASFENYHSQGLYLLFHHYWPLTGNRPKSGNPREWASHQLGEQNKATWVVVRSNGDVNSTTAYWGRVSIGNPTVGNLDKTSADILFGKLDELYRTGNLLQLPRAVEAKNKFIVGDFDGVAANLLLAKENSAEAVELIPCLPMSELDVMQQPIEPKYLDEIAHLYVASPDNYRIVQHATGVYFFYDNTSAHAILLNKGELEALEAKISSLVLASSYF